MKAFAHFFSYTCHPLFVPLFFLYIALFGRYSSYFLLDTESRFRILQAFIILAVVAPILSVLIAYKTKMISSLQMDNKEDRLFPYTMTIIYYGMFYMIIRNVNGLSFLPSLVLGSMAGLLFVLLITKYWKISAHAVGLGGLFGAFYSIPLAHNFIDLQLLLLSLFLIGAVGTSRLILKAHTQNQVLAGSILGFLCTVISLKLELVL